jgi:hypothetical protein
MARQMNARHSVRIGGASGFWGDSAVGVVQLVRRAKIDYLMLDYLAEVTMSIMAKAKTRDPEVGYATDFVTVAMHSVLREIVKCGIRVVTNAGGVNPEACSEALRALAKEQGVSLSIAVVTGDDLMPEMEKLRAAGVVEMFSGAPMPDRLLSANAYLGAFPIAAALERGADVVITGRCVDSALALGPLIHEFKWTVDDFDRLSAGSLVGHLIECGTQATGGIHTDWQMVPAWDDMGFPIAEVDEDGTFVLTKPIESGGIVTPGVAAEQLVYEIGDPSNYIMPDVTCDWTRVTMTQSGADRVRIGGARGKPAPEAYKVSTTYADGFRCSGGFTVVGMQAAAKARRAADTIIARTRRLLRESNLGDFSGVEVELLGADSLYGPRGRPDEAREVVLRLTVSHQDRAALAIFAREIAPMGTGGAPGSTGFAAGRPKPQEIARLFSFLLPKGKAPNCEILLDGAASVYIPTRSTGAAVIIDKEVPQIADAPLVGDEMEVPLKRIAWARSGDKGDICNIGVIARSDALAGVLAREISAERMREWFAHLVEGDAARYALPGIGAFNFVLAAALGGGGMASLRNDAQGKAFAQLALEMPVRVSPSVIPPAIDFPKDSAAEDSGATAPLPE